MPIEHDPSRGPNARVLVDDARRVLARYHADERDGQEWADLLEIEPGATVRDVLPVALRELGGVSVSGPPELGRALILAGGTPKRHARVMLRELRAGEAPGPPPPEGIALVALDRPVEDLVDSHLAAYAPGHPDFEHGGEDPAKVADAVRELVSGALMGPPLPSSRAALDRDGSVVGGIIICPGPGPEPFTGAWVADIWRTPGRSGVGAALLAAAIGAAAAEGYPSMGLAVTDGNPAQRVYERAGFRTMVESVNVDLPPADPVSRRP